jgi:predicted Rossmann fold nucleotide-binding protein DprA/Smf involved in DNA uptake
MPHANAFNNGARMVVPNSTTLSRDSHDYPMLLRERLGESAPSLLKVIGGRNCLSKPMVSLVCSVRCPGSIVIKTFDAIREMRDKGIVIIGGIHSPMEEECLEFLLKGEQPVLMSPAKGLNRPRFSDLQKAAIDECRLTVISIFSDEITRTTKRQSLARNEFIAAVSTAVMIPYASPGGSAEAVFKQVTARNQPVFTFEDSENDSLLKNGARAYGLNGVSSILQTKRG